MPEDRLKELEDRDREPYRRWCDQGYITATPGNIVDYSYIRQMISGIMLDSRGQPLPDKWPDCLADKYKFNGIGFDPYNATKLTTELGEYDGLPVLEVRQGYLTLNQPSKELERRVLQGKVRHDNNPVAKWMIGHCAVDSDPAGNIKPSKNRSTQKIDGVAAAVNALALALGTPCAGGTCL